jgi:hypothetical protein
MQALARCCCAPSLCCHPGHSPSGPAEEADHLPAQGEEHQLCLIWVVLEVADRRSVCDEPTPVHSCMTVPSMFSLTCPWLADCKVHFAPAASLCRQLGQQHNQQEQRSRQHSRSSRSRQSRTVWAALYPLYTETHLAAHHALQVSSADAAAAGAHAADQVRLTV